MIEKRRFVRIPVNGTCCLEHAADTFHGSIVNISRGGAMIGLKESVIIPEGDVCMLQFWLQDREPPFRAEVIVAYSSFTFLGLRFSEGESERLPELFARIEALSGATAIR